MNDNLVICRNCINSSKNEPYTSPFKFRGFFGNFKVPKDNLCPKCKSTLEKTQVTIDEFKVMYTISHDNSFLEAMIDLHDKDIIEYELKMSQFRNQVNQEKAVENKQQNNQPKCPTCNSTNLKKITSISKAGSVALFGVFAAGRTSKTWHCNNCGAEW